MENFPPRVSSESPSAFRGLIFGAIALLIILTGIVKLTNAHFERIEAAEQPPAATK